MGLWDTIFGNRLKGDDPEEEIERNKAYGDLYSGGEGRVDHVENEETAVGNQRAVKNADRLTGGLEEVERRTREMRLGDRGNRHLEKTFGKLDRAIDKVGQAENSRILQQRQEALRHKIRSGYSKIEQEHAQRIEELRRKGATDRHIKEEEHKMKKTREDMSSMYRRAGGSGMLK